VIPGKYTASFFENTDLSNAQIATFYTGAMKNSADLKLSELKKKKLICLSSLLLILKP
jgi:adenosine kinase